MSEILKIDLSEPMYSVRCLQVNESYLYKNLILIAGRIVLGAQMVCY